jgi:hypothetical protein
VEDRLDKLKPMQEEDFLGEEIHQTAKPNSALGVNEGRSSIE